MCFEQIWKNIEDCEGEIFSTRTGLPFTYRIINGKVVPDRTNYPLARSQFEKAAAVPDLQGPGQINSLVRGPAYVFAILTDPRIRG